MIFLKETFVYICPDDYGCVFVDKKVDSCLRFTPFSFVKQYHRKGLWIRGGGQGTTAPGKLRLPMMAFIEQVLFRVSWLRLTVQQLDVLDYRK